MKRFPQRPTLADVAREAGVSTATVSRVIEGSTLVTARTQAKVHQAMDQLGYFGNAAAAQLVSGRARTVGVVTSSIADYGYASVIKGIEQQARLHDMAVLIAVVEGGDDDSVRKAVATVAGHALDGVIVMDWDPIAHAVAPALPGYLPVVSTKPPAPDEVVIRPHVSIDEREGTRIAVEHLIALGHRSVFVLGSPDNSFQDGRRRGVEDALTAAHLPHYPIIQCENWSPSAGYVAASTLLDDYSDQVSAITCANDEIAVGAIRAILDRGLTVPGDISVIGFDDDPVAGYVHPALTTMRQDFISLGEQAMDLLIEVIAGSEVIDTVPAIPTLVVRESTAAPRSR